MTPSSPEMTASDVVAIVRVFEDHYIEIYLDGGWAVDALLGEQTRPHSDLDIAVEHRFVPQIRALLESHGYHDVPRDDAWECNFVLGDDQGHEIDVHSVTFDEAHAPVFGVPYPFESFSGHGSILGYPVKCIAPTWLVQFHTGYQVDENDYRDVKALCQRFGIAMPAGYEEFEWQAGEG
jgi:lincosamide nucleotidyltransferase A/C/D/E